MSRRRDRYYQMAVRGTQKQPMTDELKQRFLELIGSGYTRREACDAVDGSFYMFRELCREDSKHYDRNFARVYKHLTEKGGVHEEAKAERLEAAAIERGVRSSDRLLEKLLMVYHPRWEVLRQQPNRTQINNIKIDELRMLISSVSDETLEKMASEIEQQKQISLPDVEAA